ncbi:MULTISPECIES: signal peptidase I [Arthrobacter]|uniref:Signal peptidase I n=2 Tax=Arthrobacter TaxID=1663 RepID=A0ABU9KME1_9MICC|nr:signal peptidase I [Arthrobacter sp. YJM1]MDP5227746.1 signal peptidase I [Arthrobacter sp. YJM1]
MKRLRRILKSPWMSFVYALLAVSLCNAFLVKTFQIPSASMQNTLAEGDRILVSRLAYTSDGPQRGDVVVFNQPASWGAEPQLSPLRAAAGWMGDLIGFGPSNQHALVKRVIGLPGDTVECCDASGKVTVNGVALNEPYIFEDLPFPPGAGCTDPKKRSARCFGPIHVPAGQYLVLGDHRSDSRDSVVSCRGPAAGSDCAVFVPRSQVVGKVFGILYPFSKWGQGF